MCEAVRRRAVAESKRAMAGLKNYRELDAWRCAMTLVELVYVLSNELPDKERYGLISQLQRAATSIPTNIAEGQARATVGSGLSFLRIALAPRPNWTRWSNSRAG